MSFFGPTLSDLPWTYGTVCGNCGTMITASSWHQCAPVTSNGIPPPTFDKAAWLRRSRQAGKRHPLSPEGVCMSCGDHKIGHWQWVDESPE